MTHVELQFEYSELLHSKGLPYRLNNARPFELSKSLKQILISDQQLIDTRKQQRFFNAACREDSGWTMYVCASNILDKAKHIAANICQHYFERDLDCRWLSSLDKLDKIEFHKLRLVVIDALFFDSSNYRRDRVYEVIHHNCNIRDMSVIVIGQHSTPLELAKQLGSRPDFMLQVE